ncbi:Mitochondrial outer membrane protein porin [Dirofilaria immitis]
MRIEIALLICVILNSLKDEIFVFIFGRKEDLLFQDYDIGRCFSIRLSSNSDKLHIFVLVANQYVGIQQLVV